MQPTTASKFGFGSALLLLGALLSAPHRLAAQSQLTVVLEITFRFACHLSPAVTIRACSLEPDCHGFSQVYISPRQRSPSLLPSQQANITPVSVIEMPVMCVLKDGVGEVLALSSSKFWRVKEDRVSSRSLRLHRAACGPSNMYGIPCAGQNSESPAAAR